MAYIVQPSPTSRFRSAIRSVVMTFRRSGDGPAVAGAVLVLVVWAAAMWLLLRRRRGAGPEA